MLDRLFGIGEREEARNIPGVSTVPLIIPDATLGQGLPPMYAVFGTAHRIRALNSSEMRARFAWIRLPPENETDWTERNTEDDRDAVIVSHVGKGKCIFCAWDLGGGFLAVCCV